MTFPEAPFRSENSVMRDDTTRYLCAAVHQDSEFADAAIREYLTEPTRALPPSPGIDAATVLRDAVAARTRRLVRDWALLVIVAMFLFVSPGFALVWAVAGILLRVGGSVRRHETPAAIVASLVGPVAGLAGAYLLLALWGLITDEPSSSYTGSSPDGELAAVLGVVLAVLALAVLVLDRLAVTLLLHRSFQRTRFVAEPTVDTWPGERWVRTVGRERYRSDLARVARSDVDGNMVVYRGYEPFVGAGSRLRPRTIAFAIPLDPAENAEGHPNGSATAATRFTRTFALHELYDHVAAQLMAMRNAPSLSPSGRLARLSEQDQVLVPIEDMLVNYEEPAARVVLPNLAGPPCQSVPPHVLASVIEQPREWMRYYRCFRLETWNRELAVTGYLHFGASDRQLYLEWIPCVLLPVADHLRLWDKGPAIRLSPVALGSLADWVRLPGELLFRLGSMFRRIRPIADEPGFARPEKYGTAMSLRELAAGEQVRNYFQDSDAERYVELLTSRMLRAIGEFLEEKGISVNEFMRHATNIINNFGDNYGVNHIGAMNGEQHVGPPGNRGPAPAKPRTSGVKS